MYKRFELGAGQIAHLVIGAPHVGADANEFRADRQNALVDEGNTVVVIEHNLEVIKCADWIIDLGPEGGEKDGGLLVFEGTPEAMASQTKGYTSTFLKTKLIERP